jgi:hypothetical protein
VLTKIEEIEAGGGVEAVARAMLGGASIWGDLEVRCHVTVTVMRFRPAP